MPEANPETTYDQLPYASRVFPATHPRNLAAVAWLRGMQPAPISHCKILELGCATGANLIPIAAHYPRSHFEGIDNSSRQIAEAESFRRSLRLGNVQFHTMDIMDFDKAMGHFDYIIVHGVYSWVPEPVRHKILDICRQQLAPNGIAYISYNVLPGWHLYGTARDIMRYRVRSLRDEDPQAKVRTACEYLSAITDIVPVEKNPYLFQLKQVAGKIIRNDPSYLMHEYLAEINKAFHFHEFIDDIQGVGLRYLGDASSLGYGITPFPNTVEEKLKQLSRDTLDFEQHADFLTNREFRCALLCHKNISLHPGSETARLGPLYLSSMAKPVPLPRERFGNAQGFRCGGDTYVDPHPLFQQAMRHLIAIYPDALRFDELLAQLPGGTPADGEAAILAGKMLRARAGEILHITLDKPVVAATIAAKPKACPLACRLSRTGRQVPTPWHENAGLNDFILRLLPYLDGSRDEAGLLAAMKEDLENETTLFGVAAPPPKGTPAWEQWLQQNLQRSLEFLRYAGLLVPV